MATMKDVSKLAKVSPSTVSRTLSGSATVSPAVAKRVRRAIEQLDYSPNAVAKSLKLGHSETISMLVPSIENLVYQQVVRGAEDYARQHGYTMVLCNTDSDKEIEQRYIQMLLNKGVDGFLIATMTKDNKHILNLQKKGVPLVLVLRYIDDTLNAVGIDNFQCAYNVVSYLAETGHKNIAIVGGSSNIDLYDKRFSGYKKALKDYQLPFDDALALGQGTDDASVCLALKQLIESKRPLDAVFATNDYRAMLVMHVLDEMGLRIPKDVSVVGFDNAKVSALTIPPLTTVNQPLYDIGRSAAKRLIEMIAEKEPSLPTIELKRAELIVRGSTDKRG